MVYAKVGKWTKEYDNEYQKRVYRAERQLAMEIVAKGNMLCAKCGSKNNLQINHIDGGGRAEIRSLSFRKRQFLKNIISGIRKTNDLNILCRNCNAYRKGNHYHHKRSDGNCECGFEDSSGETIHLGAEGIRMFGSSGVKIKKKMK